MCLELPKPAPVVVLRGAVVVEGEVMPVCSGCEFVMCVSQLPSPVSAEANCCRVEL